ncbi:hypothetical protein GCM10020220_003910 [Nonomuraea rubra]
MRITSGRWRLGQAYGLGAVLRLAHDLHVARGLQQHADARADERLVVGHQHADHAALPGDTRVWVGRWAASSQPPSPSGPALRVPAEGAHALAHAGQAAPGGGQPLDGGGRAAVADLDVQSLLGGRHGYADPGAGACVLEHVRQSFLDDAGR